MKNQIFVTIILIFFSLQLQTTTQSGCPFSWVKDQISGYQTEKLSQISQAQESPKRLQNAKKISQQISCPDGEVIIDNNCVFNDLEDLSSQINVSDTVNLQWQISEDGEYITIKQKVENLSWQGVGFGIGMKDSDVVYTTLAQIENSENYILEITEGLCLNNKPPVPTEDQSAIQLLGYEITENSTTYKFKRLLKPNIQGLHQLEAGEQTHVISVYSQDNSAELNYHGPNQWQYEISLENDQTGPVICPKGQVHIKGVCQKNDLSSLSSKTTVAQGVELEWEISEDGEYLIMKQYVENLSWQGVGFGLGMEDTDTIYTQLVQNGEQYQMNLLEGLCLDGNPPVPNDDQSAIELLGYEITKTSTTFKFIRKLNPNNEELHTLKVGETVNIISVYSKKNSLTLDYHGPNKWQYQIKLQNGQTDDNDCQDGQISNQDGECVANDLSPLSSIAKISDKIRLEWEISEDEKYITIMQVVQNYSWQGVAFGIGMSNSDVVYTTIVPEGKKQRIKITEGMCLNGKPPIPAKDQSNIQLLGYSVESNKTTFKFKRKLKPTGNDGLHTLTVGSIQNGISIFSKGQSTTLDYHGPNQFQYLYELSNNVIGFEKTGLSSEFMTWHKYIFFFSWGIFIDISIVLVRNFKSYTYAMITHGIIQLIIDTATLIMGGLTLYYNRANLFTLPGEFYSNIHYLSAILLLTLVIFNHIGGVIIQYILVLPKSGNKDKYAFVPIIHRFLGHFLYFSSKITVITGLYWAQKSWVLYLIIPYSLILRGVSEFLHFKQPQSYIKAQIQPNKKLQKSPQSQEIYEMVLSGKSHKEILRAYPKFKYVIAKNKLIDISKLQHPGGNYITNICNGRDIDCFLFGGYALETTNRDQHIHSQQAQIWLENHAIGSVYDPETDILNDSRNSKQEYDQGLHINLIENHRNWTNPIYQAKITNIQHLTKSTSRFDFVISNNGKQIYPISNLYGVNWMGKHFNLKIKNQDKTRCYTIIQSMSPKSIGFRQYLINQYENNFNNSENSSKLLSKIEVQNNSLPLVIKKYEGQNTLSQKVHDLNKNADYEIQGPMGLGLRLREISSGHFMIFSGGTGILPFLDLLNFLLQKSIFEVAKKQLGVEKAREKLNNSNIGIENCLNDFKVSVYASFNSKDDFVGKDILVPLAYINKQHNLGICDLTLRFSDNSKIDEVKCINQRFDYKFMQTEFEQIKQNIQRAWVCGPPALQKQIPEIIQRYVDKENIEFI